VGFSDFHRIEADDVADMMGVLNFATKVSWVVLRVLADTNDPKHIRHSNPN
jgi:hypothetical protein